MLLTILNRATLEIFTKTLKKTKKKFRWKLNRKLNWKQKKKTKTKWKNVLYSIQLNLTFNLTLIKVFEGIYIKVAEFKRKFSYSLLLNNLPITMTLLILDTTFCKIHVVCNHKVDSQFIFLRLYLKFWWFILMRVSIIHMGVCDRLFEKTFNLILYFQMKSFPSTDFTRSNSYL